MEHVDVFIDGRLEREAVLGVNRPDVAAYYPNVPGATNSGFVIFIDSTRLTNGVYTLTVKATDDQGQQGLLGTRRFQVFNNAPNLPPFGEVEHPLLQATWFGNCLSLPGGPSGGEIRDTRYIMFVSGWALDTSIYAERGGVSHVFLEMDGVVLKDTRGAFGTLGCRREFNLNNALVDCYGFYRPDVNIFYPGFPQSANSGFFFAVDVGYLLTDQGFKEGNHMLQVKAADKEDNVTLLKELPVHLECATQNLDPSPLGYVDDPSNYEFVGGIFPVFGWALDLDGVIRVRVLIDGVAQIDAVTGRDYAEYGLPSPDVAAMYPNYPQQDERPLALLPRHDEDRELGARPPRRGHRRPRQLPLGRDPPLHRQQQHADPLSLRPLPKPSGPAVARGLFSFRCRAGEASPQPVTRQTEAPGPCRRRRGPASAAADRRAPRDSRRTSGDGRNFL